MISTVNKHELAQEIADDLIRHLDAYYSIPEIWDNELDRQIHTWYSNPPNVFPKRPYFSPSASDACPRELYYKALKYPKDSFKKQPHQGRWTEQGTAIGDLMQRTLLSIERNFEDKIGKSPRFRFERTEDGRPMFEDFAKKNHRVTHNGKSFYLFGTCDGIMEYRTKQGETLRVGLEIKSKQTTAAKTSLYSMREPEEKHVKQCFMYGEMYGVDLYVILYVNAAKKSWVVSEDDYAKNPDIRAFGIHITEEDKAEVFDRFVEILDSVEKREPLPLDPTKWTFNSYKTAIAKDITAEELEVLRSQRSKALRSKLPDFKKQAYVDVVDFIERVQKYDI